MQHKKRWIVLALLLVALAVVALLVLTRREQQLPTVAFPDMGESGASSTQTGDEGQDTEESQQDVVSEETEPAAPDTQEPTAQPQQTMNPEERLSGDTRSEDAEQQTEDTEVLFDLPTSQATPSPAATRKATKRPSATPTPSAKATDAPTANPTNTPKGTDSEWSPSIV